MHSRKLFPDASARFVGVATAVSLTCVGTLADGTELPIVLESATKDEYEWKVDGRVVETKVIAPFVTESLASSDVPTDADARSAAVRDSSIICGEPTLLVPTAIGLPLRSRYAFA